MIIIIEFAIENVELKNIHIGLPDSPAEVN